MLILNLIQHDECNEGQLVLSKFNIGNNIAPLVISWKELNITKCDDVVVVKLMYLLDEILNPMLGT
jgi:hypothetical protein